MIFKEKYFQIFFLLCFHLNEISWIKCKHCRNCHKKNILDFIGNVFSRVVFDDDIEFELRINLSLTYVKNISIISTVEILDDILVIQGSAYVRSFEFTGHCMSGVFNLEWWVRKSNGTANIKIFLGWFFT